jgi:hypothetical protein
MVNNGCEHIEASLYAVMLTYVMVHTSLKTSNTVDFLLDYDLIWYKGMLHVFIFIE